MLDGYTGAGVHISCMAVPDDDRPVSAVLEQGPEALASFKRLLVIFKEMSDEMKHVGPETIEAGCAVVAEIDEFLQNRYLTN